MSTNPKELFTDSSRFTAANFVSTELVAGITQAQDTFEVRDASQWPSLEDGEFFLAVIVSATDNDKKEVVKVTNVAGSTWTVERAFEDGTSFAFPAQSSVENRLTSGTIGYFRGMTLKGVGATNVTAHPFCEYLSNGGQTFDLVSADFVEGQRCIFRMASVENGTFSTITVDGVDFATISGKGDSLELAMVGGDFVVTKRSVDNAKNTSVMTADFTAHPNLDYFVDMSDDIDKNITVDADIIRGGDSFKVYVKDPTGTPNVFINLLFAAGTYAPDSEATTVFIEAATNASYRIQNVNGKFYIIDAAGESYDGAYVMQRLGELETKVSELQSTAGFVDIQSTVSGNTFMRKYNDGTFTIFLNGETANFAIDNPYGSLYQGSYNISPQGVFPDEPIELTLEYANCSKLRSGTGRSWVVDTSIGGNTVLVTAMDINIRPAGTNAVYEGVIMGTWEQI